MDWAAWLVAWEPYALGAAMTGQLEFADAQAHKAVVIEVAAMAVIEGRSTALAVMYDEMSRLVPLALAVASLSAALAGAMLRKCQAVLVLPTMLAVSWASILRR